MGIQKTLRKVRKGIHMGFDGVNRWQGKRLRLGFIGCGTHAQESLYPAISYSPFELVATCARHRDHAESVGKRYGATAYYDDYQQMLRNESLDAVMVSVNPQIHYEVATIAEKRSLPVFVEKPPAPTSQKAKSLLGGKVMVGFQKRFAPAYVKAKEIIQGSAFGTPHLFDAVFCVGETGNQRALIFDTGIHMFDLVRFFFGDITTVTYRNVRSGSVSSFAFVLQTRSGAVGTITMTDQFSWPKMVERLEIFGEESRVMVDNLHTVYYDKPTVARPGVPSQLSEMSVYWRPSYPVGTVLNQSLFLNGYGYEVLHFGDVVSGRSELISSIDDGIAALEIIEYILS